LDSFWRTKCRITLFKWRQAENVNGWPAGITYWLAMTAQEKPQVSRLYVDGRPAGAGNHQGFSARSSTRTTSAPLEFGRTYPDADPCAQSAFQDFRFFQRATLGAGSGTTSHRGLCSGNRAKTDVGLVRRMNFIRLASFTLRSAMKRLKSSTPRSHL